MTHQIWACSLLAGSLASLLRWESSGIPSNAAGSEPSGGRGAVVGLGACAEGSWMCRDGCEPLHTRSSLLSDRWNRAAGTRPGWRGETLFTPSPGQQWELAATRSAVWGELAARMWEKKGKNTIINVRCPPANHCVLSVRSQPLQGCQGRCADTLRCPQIPRQTDNDCCVRFTSSLHFVCFCFSVFTEKNIILLSACVSHIKHISYFYCLLRRVWQACEFTNQSTVSAAACGGFASQSVWHRIRRWILPICL